MFILRARLVSETRYRVFAARNPDGIQQIIRDVRADSGTELAEFAEVNGEPGRVHLLVNFAGPAGGAPIRPFASTPSSRTARLTRPGPSAITTDLKAGALADILVALPFPA